MKDKPYWKNRKASDNRGAGQGFTEREGPPHMDRLNHWRYLLSLEKEFTETLRYVEFTPSQESVYSFEFTRLLILICSELDVLLKVVCDSACPKGKPGTIGEYFPCIAGKYQIQLEAGRVDRLSLRVVPFNCAAVGPRVAQ